jgi:uncharacterized membrane protein HdeD (DUF308 family)
MQSGDWTGGLFTALSDFSNMRKSVIVDMIMVQLISLTLGCFIIIAFNSNNMDSTSLSYLLVVLFGLFSFTGIVYRRFAHQG